jgi:hypothetical protein
LFKTTSQTEINNLKAQLARFGHLLQKDDPELPSFVDLNENNFSNNNNTISNNIYQQQELINGLVDELMDAENNIMPPGDMEALKSAYEQMWTSFVKVARQFAQINQQDDVCATNQSL